MLSRVLSRGPRSALALVARNGRKRCRRPGWLPSRRGPLPKSCARRLGGSYSPDLCERACGHPMRDTRGGSDVAGPIEDGRGTRCVDAMLGQC